MSSFSEPRSMYNSSAAAFVVTAGAVIAIHLWVVSKKLRQRWASKWPVPYMRFTSDEPEWHVENPLQNQSEGGQPNTYSGMQLDVRRHTVVNGRDKSLTYKSHGLELLQVPTEVTNFFDATQLDTVYEPEAVKVVKAVTGCSRVFVFDYTCRTTDANLQAAHKTRTPAIWVHGDYTLDSATKKLEAIIPAAQRDASKEKRWCIVNLWRSTHGSVQRKPMIFLLNSRAAASDGHVVNVARVSQYQNRRSSIQMVRYGGSHSWVTFPHMNMGEAVIFRTFDSSDPHGAIYHTAADDPSTTPQSPARHSIEVRALCIWD